MKSYKTDVIVVGGGPSGISAALSAARSGVSVLLVERYGFLGGNAAAMLGNLCGFYTSGDIKRIVGGIGWELIQTLKERGAVKELLDDQGIGVIPYNHEVLKQVADQMLAKEDIVLLFHSLAVDTDIDDRGIRSVVIENKSGRQRIFAKVIIDATGDGDVAAQLGAEYYIPDKPQAMTMMFILSNIDVPQAKKVQGSRLKKLLQEAIRSGQHPLPRYDGGFRFIPGMAGTAAVNMTRIGSLLGTQVIDLTQAEIEGRRQVTQYSEFLRENVPGFHDVFVSGIATQVGVRETRLISGEYTLTENDILGARTHFDAIGQCAWPVELHKPDDDGSVCWENLPDGQSYDIPFRCLIPISVEGLLVVGRCASTTHIAQASTRVTGPCMLMGHAAGVAAALSLHKNTQLRKLDPAHIRHELEAQGAILR